MGGGDRIFRAIVGLAVLGAGFYFQSWWGLVGLIPLGTAAIGWCPAYTPFGISTAGKDSD
jgi:hypothetical protein